MPEQKPIIRFENVTKTYLENTPVLNKVNLVIYPGEFLSLVGASGVGKSTLLKLIYVKYTIGGTTYTLCANGKSPTGGNCTATTGMPVNSAQTMVLVGSKPTVTVATPTNVTISTGTYSEAIDVTIAADNAGPITVISFPVTVSLTGAGSSGTLTVATGSGNPFIVKDKNGNTISTVTGNFTSGSAGTATVTLNSTTGYLIPAGSSETFKVFVPIATITSGGSATWYNRITTNLAATAAFSWLDTAGNATNPTGANVTGNILNYPSTTAVTVQQ
jgi:energy-coupling factor transporter ATP-binding protein EcfA2